MKPVRVRQRRSDPPTGLTQPVGDVVIFAAPADKVLIETVNRLEVFTRNSNVVASQLRLCRMAYKLVVLFFDSLVEQSLPLVPRAPSAERAGSNCRLVNAIGRLF